MKGKIISEKLIKDNWGWQRGKKNYVRRYYEIVTEEEWEFVPRVGRVTKEES